MVHLFLFALNLKIAIDEVKEDFNNKLNQEQMKHNKEIEDYQSKYKTLLEELEQLRKQPRQPRKVVKDIEK